MKIIVCLDDNNGMAFNGRRQSRDKTVRADMLALAGGRLRMSPYSARQFTETPTAWLAADNFWQNAGPDDYCFFETEDPAPWASAADEIVIYHWHRVYPADVTFTVPLSEDGWKLTETTDLRGTSHETITREVYAK